MPRQSYVSTQDIFAILCILNSLSDIQIIMVTKHMNMEKEKEIRSLNPYYIRSCIMLSFIQLKELERIHRSRLFGITKWRAVTAKMNNLLATIADLHNAGKRRQFKPWRVSDKYPDWKLRSGLHDYQQPVSVHPVWSERAIKWYNDLKTEIVCVYCNMRVQICIIWGHP